MKSTAITDYHELETELRQKLTNGEQSLQTVTDATQISKTHLANFKNGKRNLSFQNLTRLAEYFQVRYVLKNF